MTGKRFDISAIALFLLFVLPLWTSAQKPIIWIDTDMLFGKMKKDVDDGLALMMALGNDSVQIAGISVVDKVDYGFKITGKFLKWYGNKKKIAVYRGADRPFVLGEKTDAVKGLAAALQKQKLTIVGLGPVTNIATTLQLYPELKDSVDRIVLCMGRQPGTHFNPGNGKKNLNDYNFDMAPDAAEFILSTHIPLVLCGYEASSNVYLNKTDFKFLKKNGTHHDRKIYRRLKTWAFEWKLFLGSKKGFIPFDAVTLSYILRSDLIESKNGVGVQIKLQDNDSRFKNLGEQKKYLLASGSFHSPVKAVLCNGSKEGMKEYILHSLKKTLQGSSMR